MKLFNDIQKTVIKDYISRNIELIRDIWRPEIHGDELSIIYDEKRLTNKIKRKATNIIADGEVITRVYTKLKFENRLAELFSSDNPVLHTDLTINEWNLIFDYMTDVYNETFIYTERHRNALAELEYLIDNNEIWRLFEDDFYPEFLIPSGNNE